MIPLPDSLAIRRLTEDEQFLEKKATEAILAEQRAPGIHASDLLNERLAYWNRKNPTPIPPRLIRMFLVGRVLHGFILSAADSGTFDSIDTDAGSRRWAEVGLAYSPDRLEKGRPVEVKTSRSFYEPKTVRDLDLYAEQLLIYMAAENVTTGKLWVLYLNLKDEQNKTSPEFRCYHVSVSKPDLTSLRDWIHARTDALTHSLATDDPSGLTLCREWVCGVGNCGHWSICQPPGRYGVEGWGSKPRNKKKETTNAKPSQITRRRTVPRT